MEYVVLVDELDNEIGVEEKMKAHELALLHRAFSVFVFNDRGEILLQQRAISKYHSGGLWTNTCCSHPRPHEQVEDAAMRRLQEEMGFATPLTKAFHFIYKADFDNGLTEHELDHVFIGKYNNAIDFNRDEVESYKYETLEVLEKHIEEEPEHYTVWFKIALPKLKEWMGKDVFYSF